MCSYDFSLKTAVYIIDYTAVRVRGDITWYIVDELVAVSSSIFHAPRPGRVCTVRHLIFIAEFVLLPYTHTRPPPRIAPHCQDAATCGIVTIGRVLLLLIPGS